VATASRPVPAGRAGLAFRVDVQALAPGPHAAVILRIHGLIVHRGLGRHHGPFRKMNLI